ncbi:MAG: hypothetical protein FWE35_20840 [Streptosporangiales bacterium]|jgi:methionine synthase II (cobalamin-independent)|nr:hypothetical protein [Streptosporangiales bacterium]
MALRTTVVGSWWPYPEEETALARLHAGGLSDEHGRDLLDRCAARAIAEQRDFGFAEWTGGEYFADRFVLHLAKTLTGVTIDVPPEDDEFDYDDLGHLHVDGDITAPNGLGYLEAYLRESKLPGGVRKAAVVSPFEILVTADPGAVQERMPELLAIVNRELRGLAEAGCPHTSSSTPRSSEAW